MKASAWIRAAAMGLAVLPLAALAHRAWLLPSTMAASGQAPVVTVDGAVSENLFDFDGPPLKLDGLSVLAPDGSAVPVDNLTVGRHRSSFDFSPRIAGTYRIANVERSAFASYSVGGEAKRWRGRPDALAAELPAGAENLQVTQVHQRVEAFVRYGDAEVQAMAASGVGLELQPEKPLPELTVGDSTGFRLLIDGAPATEVLVTVVRGGNRFRYKLGELTLKTDRDGHFRVTWPEAGVYWLSATVSTPRGQPASAARPAQRASYSATFEVLPR